MHVRISQVASIANNPFANAPIFQPCVVLHLLCQYKSDRVIESFHEEISLPSVMRSMSIEYRSVPIEFC